MTTPQQNGGGYRTNTFQDLLGAIIAQNTQNSLSSSTAAQTAVLNDLVAYPETLAMSDSTTLTNGTAGLSGWGSFTFNAQVYR